MLSGTKTLIQISTLGASIKWMGIVSTQYFNLHSLSEDKYCLIHVGKVTASLGRNC